MKIANSHLTRLFPALLVALGVVVSVGCQDSDLTGGPTIVDSSGPIAEPEDPCPPPDVATFPVVVNEIILQNVDILDDNGELPPAIIELYNPTDQPVELSGAHFSDDADDEELWEIPCVDGTIIEPFGFFLIYLDGDEESLDDFNAPFVPEITGFVTFILNGAKIITINADDIGPGEALGRFPDGEGDFEVLVAPSPGAPNEGEIIIPFVRGDVDGNGVVDSLDLDLLLTLIQNSDAFVPCADALDVNDDGVIDVSDATFLGQALASDGPEIPAPFPNAGTDPTDTDLLPPCEEE